MSFKGARMKAGKSVVEVMTELGVTEGAVYQWESGYSYPTVKKLVALAEFYGCTVDDLLRGEDHDD